VNDAALEGLKGTFWKSRQISLFEEGSRLNKA